MLNERDRKFEMIQKIVFEEINVCQLDVHCKEFCMALVVLLLHKCELSNFPRLALSKGFSIVGKLIASALSDSMRMSVLWSDIVHITSLVKSRLLSHRCMEHIVFDSERMMEMSRAILDAFLSVHLSGDPIQEEWGGLSRHDPGNPVQYITLPGPPLGCILLRNTLVMDIPVPSALCRHAAVSKALLTVALFDCSLEMPNADHMRVFEVATILPSQTTEDSQQDISAEMRLLTRFADVLQDSGVTLVACQRRVHPALQRLLAAKGVVCLPRVSVRYMCALQRLSGARLLGAMPVLNGDGDCKGDSTIDPASLGVLSSLRCEFICGKQFVVASALPGADCRTENGTEKRTGSFCSLIVTATSESAAARTREAVEDTMGMLRRLLDDPYVMVPKWRESLVDCLMQFDGTCTMHSQGGHGENKAPALSRTAAATVKAVHLYADCVLSVCTAEDRARECAQVALHCDALSSFAVVTRSIVRLLDIDSVICVNSESKSFK